MQTLQLLSLSLVLFVGCTKDNSSKLVTGANTKSAQNKAARISVAGGYTTYWINSTYESNYSHFCQLSSSLSNRSLACGPTCYMLCAHMLIGSSFPSSDTKLTAIVNRLSSVYHVSLPIGIIDIPPYVIGTDNPPLTTVDAGYTNSSRLIQGVGTTAGRNDFKTALQKELGDGFPVIVPVNLASASSSRVNDSRYTSSISTTNYDIDASDVLGRNYYLTGDTHGIGHFVVLIGIYVNNSTGEGLVYYKDPLATSGTTKIASYTRFLNSALANGGSSSSYDAVVIRR